MSLSFFRLNQSSLLAEVLHIIRPNRPNLPSRVAENIQNLHSLDLYLKNQKLTSCSVIYSMESTAVCQSLSLQVLHGVCDNAQETAAALRLWAGLIGMKTRAIRFAATKLMIGVLGEFVAMISDPTICSVDTSIVLQIAKELWQRFLFDSHLDVNGYQRALVVKNISKWSIICPEYFWNEEAGKILAYCLQDDQDSVRNESMRQLKKIWLSLAAEVSQPILIRFCKDILIDYAEHDAVSGSVNRRIALEILAQVERPRQVWCRRTLMSCLDIKEPPVTVGHALRLVWSEQLQNLAKELLAFRFRDEDTATLLGKTFINVRPNHAWDELSHTLGIIELSSLDITFILSILLVMAKSISDTKVMDLVEELIDNHTPYRHFAANFMLYITSPDDRYFNIVDQLIDLQVSEVALVIERWTPSDLLKGGHLIVSKKRASASAKLSGLVTAETYYPLAAKLQYLVKLIDSPEFLKEFEAFSRESCNPRDTSELHVVVRGLSRLYSTVILECESHVRVQINGAGIYKCLSNMTTHLTREDEDTLVYLRFLEILNVFISVESPVSTLFPASRAAQTSFVAGGVDVI